MLSFVQLLMEEEILAGVPDVFQGLLTPQSWVHPSLLHGPGTLSCSILTF